MDARRPDDAPEPSDVPGDRSPGTGPTGARAPRRHVVVVGALALTGAVAAAVAWWLTGDHELDRGDAASGRVRDAESFGARGDGTTDDTAALQRALDALADGTTLRLAEGRTYVHSDVLLVRRPGVTVRGAATLLATQESRSSLTLAADRVTLREVTLRIASMTRRWDAFEQQRLRLDGHSGIQVLDVTVDGSAAAGVYVGGGSSSFRLSHLRVSDTRADGIHLTQGARSGRVESPEISASGDDGIAVVSYEQDGDPCRDIVVQSPVVRSTTGGRGLSVVGGRDVSYLDVDVSSTAAAAVYVSVEGAPYDTSAVQGVTVRGGTIRGANQDHSIDHGAVLVYAGRDDLDISDVTISDLEVSDTRASASRDIGLLASEPDQLRRVRVHDVRVWAARGPWWGSTTATRTCGSTA